MSRIRNAPPRRAHRSLAIGGALAVAAALLLVLQPREIEPARGRVYAAGGDPLFFALRDHRVDLDAHASARFASTHPDHVVIEVASGRVRSRVHPLREGASFSVKTDLVLVEVVGTAFSVEQSLDCSRVEVAHGRVRVTERATQGVSLLGPGQSLRVCAQPEPRAISVVAAIPSPEPRAPTVLQRRERVAPGEALVREALVELATDKTSVRASRLLERYLREHARGLFAEDALYHLCLIAARRGDIERSRDLARGFLSRFAASARATRLREWLADETRSDVP